MHASRCPRRGESSAGKVWRLAALLIHIDQIWRSKEGSYDQVILVGHSMGALLAAHFKDDESILEEDKSVAQARPWAHCVDRLVLLAGMNRGWQISHHLSLTGAAGWLLGLLLCRICMMFNTAGRCADRSVARVDR